MAGRCVCVCVGGGGGVGTVAHYNNWLPTKCYGCFRKLRNSNRVLSQFSTPRNVVCVCVRACVRVNLRECTHVSVQACNSNIVSILLSTAYKSSWNNFRGWIEYLSIRALALQFFICTNFATSLHAHYLCDNYTHHVDIKIRCYRFVSILAQ